MANAKRTGSRRWKWIPGAALCVVGALVLGLGLRRIVAIRAARSWPTAPGAVLKTDAAGAFVYGFTVEGLTYESEWIRRPRGTPDVGDSVTVHYDPSAPSNASLDADASLAGVGKTARLAVASGSLLLLIGVGLTAFHNPRILGQRADPFRAQGVLKANQPCSKPLARQTWDGAESSMRTISSSTPR
jgi:hypothetical protein